MILRSTGWSGPAPSVGAVLVDPDGATAVVESVAAGPGAGQWRIEARPVSSFAWSVPFPVDARP